MLQRLGRVAAYFNDGGIGVVAHRQGGPHNGSSSWSFTRDDLAIRDGGK